MTRGTTKPDARHPPRYVRRNDRGLRIGEDHPNARLTDAEVEALLADRAAGLSLSALARKWGMSKSGVKGIIDGRSRAQHGERHLGDDVRRAKCKSVRVNLRLPLHVRAKLHRLGGSRWIVRTLEAL
jgi:hypothetical protein